MSYLSTIKDRDSVITAISKGLTFPDSIVLAVSKYRNSIDQFRSIVLSSESTAQVLERIRATRPEKHRMTYLKIFRRCVCLILDTEKTKKIKAVSTASLVSSYGSWFKPIDILKQEFSGLQEGRLEALCGLVAEYDTRGQSGYDLAAFFFDWFEEIFLDWDIIGPKGAGPDAQLRKHVPSFHEDCPCDFIAWCPSGTLRAIGFVRYDATRGGAQSDDRTGGNANKIDKVRRYTEQGGQPIKIIFISDGPGLTHRDTWQESCRIDDSLDGQVRVSTLKLCKRRITPEWLLSSRQGDQPATAQALDS